MPITTQHPQLNNTSNSYRFINLFNPSCSPPFYHNASWPVTIHLKLHTYTFAFKHIMVQQFIPLYSSSHIYIYIYIYPMLRAGEGGLTWLVKK